MVYFNKFSKIAIGYLSLLFVFWFLLQQSRLQTSFWNYLYSFLFSLTPLIGGITGIFITREWGFQKSAMGRAIFYISLGLFSWGAGSMIWSYYNFFLNVAAPYPSLADIGFTLSLPLWIVGMMNLSKATGVQFGLRRNKGKVFLVIVPIIITILSYYFLVIVARQGQLIDGINSNNKLKLFFDLIYPLGDVLILTVSVLIFGLSYNYFGGKYKVSILSILIGFISMYFADFVFSYTTTTGNFYNGNWGDMLFTIALFLITFGILSFYREEFYLHK